MKKNVQFLLEPLSCLINASQNQTLLEALLEAGIDIDHSCGGNGTCGTCRVHIESGFDSLPPPNEVEAELRNELPFDSHERLACQNYAHEGLIVKLREKKL